MCSVNTFSQGRQQQKQATRSRILAVARAHFEAHGFEATSVRTIAEECGVAAGTVLLHFADKRDLLNAALFDDLAATLAEARRPTGGALREDLLAIARSFLAYYERRPRLSRALLKEALLAESPWAERFAAQVGELHAHLATLVEAARARGELARDADAARLGAAFFSFYYFALIAWVQGAHPAPLAMIDALLTQHLAGVRPGKRGKKA
jgi:AcrR family transcriptional regulator